MYHPKKKSQQPTLFDVIHNIHSSAVPRVICNSKLSFSKRIHFLFLLISLLLPMNIYAGIVSTSGGTASTSSSSTTTTIAKATKIYSYPITPTMFLHPVHNARRKLLKYQQNSLKHRVNNDDEIMVFLNQLHQPFESYTGKERLFLPLIPRNSSSIDDNDNDKYHRHHLASLLQEIQEQAVDHDRILRNFEKSRKMSRFEQHRRNMNINDNTYQSVPLSQGPGTHYATLWVGTPFQRVTAIVDTGSHDTAFPCDKCVDCGTSHTDIYFYSEKSSTFSYNSCGSENEKCPQETNCKEGKCEYGVSYREGSSWRAYSSKDKFVIGPNHATGVDDENNTVAQSAVTWNVPPHLDQYAIEFSFGCEFKVSGLFKGQLADGIMGMDKNGNTIVKAMYRDGKIEQEMFSMCFQKSLVKSQAGVTAGVLTIGGIDERLQQNPMIYAKSFSRSNGWFTVKVKGIYLGIINKDGTKDIKVVTKDEFKINSGAGIIIDSGTTDTYLGSSFKGTFDILWKEFPSTMNIEYIVGKYTTMTAEEVSNLPTIYIHIETNDQSFFNENALKNETEFFRQGYAGLDLSPDSPQDVLLAIPPEHYMERDIYNRYSPYVSFSESSGGVLGANAMMGHDVLFDMKNDRIGFAKSDCKYVTESVVDDDQCKDDNNNEVIPEFNYNSMVRTGKSCEWVSKKIKIDEICNIDIVKSHCCDICKYISQYSKPSATSPPTVLKQPIVLAPKPCKDNTGKIPNFGKNCRWVKQIKWKAEICNNNQVKNHCCASCAALSSSNSPLNNNISSPPTFNSSVPSNLKNSSSLPLSSSDEISFPMLMSVALNILLFLIIITLVASIFFRTGNKAKNNNDNNNSEEPDPHNLDIQPDSKKSDSDLQSIESNNSIVPDTVHSKSTLLNNPLSNSISSTILDDNEHSKSRLQNQDTVTATSIHMNLKSNNIVTSQPITSIHSEADQVTNIQLRNQDQIITAPKRMNKKNTYMGTNEIIADEDQYQIVTAPKKMSEVYTSCKGINETIEDMNSDEEDVEENNNSSEIV